MPVPITTTLAGVQVAARVSGPEAPQPPSVQRARASAQGAVASADAVAPVEIGGPGGPEPTRYGDWERRGRCIDF
jgi:hypothetical protein